MFCKICLHRFDNWRFSGEKCKNSECEEIGCSYCDYCSMQCAPKKRLQESIREYKEIIDEIKEEIKRKREEEINRKE